MKRDKMPQALAALLGALAMLLALQLLHGFIPGLESRIRNTRFFLPPFQEPPADWESLGQDPPDAEKSTPLPPDKIHTSQRDIRGLFQDMDRRRLRRLRIAWFADSLTEGDVLSGSLRKMLQKRYGGKGTGFHGFNPKDAPYSYTLLHKHAEAWERFNYFSLKTQPDLRLPFSGELYLAKDKTWVEYQAFKRDAVLGEGARLFYGPPREGARDLERVRVKADKESSELVLGGVEDLNRAGLPKAKKLRLEFDVSPLRPLYGVSFDSSLGVGLDNFSMRGNGGDLLYKLDAPLLKAFQKELGYKLLVLHYGLNALQEGETDFRWYRSILRKSIQHLKASLPGVSLAMVSVLDSGTKGKDGVVHTNKSLPYVLAAQRAAAMDEGIVFIDCFHLMGGPGTIRRWAEQTPQLANKDYSHLTWKGGERIAEILFEQLSGEKP